MPKNILIRTVYLYLFALIGLVLLVIGGVRFIDMGLRSLIFTKADEEQRLNYKQPLYAPVPIEKIQGIKNQKVENATLSLTPDEKISLIQWLAQYESWQSQQSRIDPVVVQRERDVSINLALLLVGLPLYLFHWGAIKKEMKKNESAQA